MNQIPLKDAFQKKLREQWCSKPKSKYKRNKNITGFYNTKKVDCKHCVQGYMYQYKGYDFQKEKPKYINSTDLRKLKEKVKNMGYKWEIINVNKALKTANKENLLLKDLK